MCLFLPFCDFLSFLFQNSSEHLVLDAAFIELMRGKEKYFVRSNERDNCVYSRLAVPFSFIFGIPEIGRKT